MWVLLGRDPRTGVATAVAGVLGVEGESRFVSWMPYSAAAEQWQERWTATTAPIAEAVRDWEEADGVAWDLVELEAPGSPDLRGDVEAVLDEFLAAGGEP